MAIQFSIVTGGSVPVYRQIADQVRKAVATGALQPGEQLPSVRALAEQLVINPNTVARAYNDLAAEAVISGQAGKGVFVAVRRQVFSLTERRRRLDAALEALLSETMLLDFDSAEILQRLKQKLHAIESKQCKRGGNE